jgi:hypothetical protein
VITSELLEAHLACPTKCYLRSIGEVGSGNAYADWDKARGESYRREGIGRLAASSSQDLACGRIEASRLKKARWQLALDQVFRAEDLEASVHAVQRLSMGGKPQTSELTPIRFVRTNKLSHADRLPSAAPRGGLTRQRLHLSTRNFCSDNRDQFKKRATGPAIEG